MENSNITYYFDMDGVIAEWNENASIEEVSSPGYFRKRKPEEKVIELMHKLKAEGYGVKILSAVYENDYSAKDKEAWIEQNGLSDIDHIFVPYGKDKNDYIDNSEDKTAVLIDDFGKNLTAWQNAGHTAVKFFNGINDRPKFIEEDGKLTIKHDTWTGFSIDHKMPVFTMLITLTGITAEIAKRQQEKKRKPPTRLIH